MVAQNYVMAYFKRDRLSATYFDIHFGAFEPISTRRGCRFQPIGRVADGSSEAAAAAA